MPRPLTALVGQLTSQQRPHRGAPSPRWTHRPPNSKQHLQLSPSNRSAEAGGCLNVSRPGSPPLQMGHSRFLVRQRASGWGGVKDLGGAEGGRGGDAGFGVPNLAIVPAICCWLPASRSTLCCKL